MDSLQQSDEKKPESKVDDLKKLAQQAMSQAKADAEMKSSSTFYNPLAQKLPVVTKTAAMSPKRQQPPSAKKLQMPQSMPKGSTIAVNKTNNQQTAQKPKTTVGTGLNLNQPSSSPLVTAKAKPVGSPARKGKLAIPVNKAKSATAPQPVVPTKKSTVPSGSNALKTKLPASSPVTPPVTATAKKINNNQKDASAAKIVVGTTNDKPPSKPVAATKPKIPATATKQSKATGPTPKTTSVTPPVTATAKKLDNNQKNASAAKPVVGTSDKPPAKAVAANNPTIPATATKPSKATGPTPKTTTNPKISAPKSTPPPPQQQEQTTPSASKDPAPTKDSSQAKQQQQQPRPTKQQQTAAPVATAGKPPATKAQPPNPNNLQKDQPKSAAPNPIPSSNTAESKKGQDATTKEPVPAASSKPVAAPAASPTTTASTTTAPAKTSDAVVEDKSDPTPEAGEQDSTNSSSQTEEEKKNGLDEGVLREKLQEQQQAFEQQLEEQRQLAETQMQQLQNQFSDQLQRLEEHHRQETEHSANQQKAAVSRWQQQVRDREMLLEAQSQQAESKEADSQAMIENLSKQLKQSRELIKDKEKADRRLQELHLKQLRDMEKQCFKKDDASNSLVEDIQKLTVSTIKHRSYQKNSSSKGLPRRTRLVLWNRTFRCTIRFCARRRSSHTLSVSIARDGLFCFGVVWCRNN